MEVNQELTDVQPIKFSVNILEYFTDTIHYHFKNRTFLNYDDDSLCQPPSLVDADSTYSLVFSDGNTTLSTTHECIKMEVEEHGLKIL